MTGLPQSGAWASESCRLANIPHARVCVRRRHREEGWCRLCPAGRASEEAERLLRTGRQSPVGGHASRGGGWPRCSRTWGLRTGRGLTAPRGGGLSSGAQCGTSRGRFRPVTNWQTIPDKASKPRWRAGEGRTRPISLFQFAHDAPKAGTPFLGPLATLPVCEGKSAWAHGGLTAGPLPGAPTSPADRSALIFGKMVIRHTRFILENDFLNVIVFLNTATN